MGLLMMSECTIPLFTGEIFFAGNQELSTWKDMSLLYSSKLYLLFKGSNVIFTGLLYNDVFGFSAD